MTRVAIVGAGYMAQEHARAFSGLPGVELVGVFSRTRASAQQLADEWGFECVASSIHELYERTRADLVVVTVRELAMREIATACFRYPWTVLLEKPAGYDLADAEAILAASADAAAGVYVALNRRAYASTRAAADFLVCDDGRRLIVVQDQQDIAGALESGQPTEVARNYMFANSIHVIDYFRQFGRGEVVDVIPSVPWTPDSPGFVVSTILFSSGDVGLYQGVWNGPGPWAVSVTTPDVRLEMRPLESLGVQKRNERRLTAQDADPIDSEFKPGLRFQAMQAIAAARRQPSALATLLDATESMRLCARIFSLT